jgi:hypothetical protein
MTLKIKSKHIGKFQASQLHIGSVVDDPRPSANLFAIRDY